MRIRRLETPFRLLTSAETAILENNQASFELSPDGSIVLAGLVFSLHPTPAQARLLKKIGGAQRWLWNRFLDANKKRYEAEKKFLFYNEMAAALPALKQEFPWLKEIPSQSLQQTLKKLEKAIKACYKYDFGFPKFKVYGISVDSALFPQGFTVGRNAITFPKNGIVYLDG